MNFLYFILIGAIAGWVSGKLIKGEGYGLLGNIVVELLALCWEDGYLKNWELWNIIFYTPLQQRLSAQLFFCW